MPRTALQSTSETLPVSKAIADWQPVGFDLQIVHAVCLTNSPRRAHPK